MNKFMKKIISLIIVLTFAFLNLTLVNAQPDTQPSNASMGLMKNPREMNDMTKEAADAANLGDISVGVLVALGVQTVLSFLAIICLVLTLIAGFKWMTAQGNEEQIKKATASIKAAIIGLIIVIAAYTITWFIFRILPLGGGVGGGGGTSG